MPTERHSRRFPFVNSRTRGVKIGSFPSQGGSSLNPHPQCAVASYRTRHWESRATPIGNGSFTILAARLVADT